jgi:prepilin-type N-terminal cleavage/methylation domain-containing protein
MRKNAFTLIELLVVIAVIAILAAIIFPVFARAKAAANKTATLSGLRQLGTACALYLADNDDVWMGATDGTDGANLAGGWMFYSQFGNEVPGVFDIKKGSLYPYVKSPAIYRSTGAAGPPSPVTFAVNSCLSERGVAAGFNPGRSNSVIPDPSGVMALGEEGISYRGVWGRNGPTNDAYFNVMVDEFSAWHNGKTAVLFADNSAKTIDPNAQKLEVLMGKDPRFCL